MQKGGMRAIQGSKKIKSCSNIFKNYTFLRKPTKTHRLPNTAKTVLPNQNPNLVKK